MRQYILYLANLVASLTPATRSFSLRRLLYSRAGVQIAKNAKLCGGSRIYGRNVRIGEATWVGPHVQLMSTQNAVIEIGSRCDVGPSCLFVVGTHALGTKARRAGRGQSAPIHVGSGSWIGAHSTFIAGASVGQGCVVAAGSVVTGTFPDSVLIGGVPATVLRTLVDEDGPRSA